MLFSHCWEEYYFRPMNWLQRPYPYEIRFWRKALNAFGVGVFVSLFLLVFKPFGLSGVPESYYLRIFGGYGLVTFLGSMLVDAGMPLLLPRLYREERWTVLTQIMHVGVVLVVIAVGNYLFSTYWHFTEAGWSVFFNFLWITLLVGLIPIIFMVMLTQVYLLKRNLRDAQVMNQKLHPHLQKEGDGKNWLALHGDNQDDLLKVEEDDLLYMQAADNYVEVYYLKDGGVTQQLLRTTLSNLEDELTEQPEIVRCHRSYIVNLSRVSEVSGNAQGYRLHVHPDLEPVPVSRSQKGRVRQRLAEV